jgi:hypothetical protein
MTKKTLIPFFLFVLIGILACDVEINTGDDQDLVGTAVAGTQTAMGGPTEQEPPPAATAGGSTPEIAADTPMEVCAPVHPGRQILSLPAGVAAGLNGTITFTNVQNQILSFRQVVDMTFMDSDWAQLAGNLSAGNDNLPIVYFALAGGGKLRLNINNAHSDLAPAANLTSITGAEGTPFTVYVTLDMINQSTNRLYAGNYQALSGAQPILTWVPPQQGQIGNALHPLAVRFDGGAARGIWFTYTMEGIGNVNYPPYNGLTYLDLSNNQQTEFLGTANALGGMSPDQTMIAYGAGQGGTPGLIRDGLTVRNLITCQETYIPFNPASNLGGGWTVFSPDNQFVAWTEASGPGNMEASFRIRVARTSGASLFDAPIENMTSLLGGEAPNGLRPVGWIADHLLVVEAYLEVIHKSVLVVWAPDPAQPLDPVLGANQSVPIGDGVFIGFVYP